MKAKLSRNGWISMLLLSVLLLSVLPMSALAALNDEDQVTSTEFTLSGYGYGQPAAACRVISAKSGAATEVYIYEQGVCDQMNGGLTADRYLLAGKQYYFLIRYNAHPEDTAGFADAFKPEETPLLLNGEPCEFAEYYQENNITGEEFYTAYYKLPVLEAIPVVIPFTKTVELGGDLAPKSNDFELEVNRLYIGDQMMPLDFDGLRFSMEGAGTAQKYFTITYMDYGAILYLLEEGLLVREKDEGCTGWEYDDSVWCVMLHHDAEDNALDEEAPAITLALDEEAPAITLALDFFKGRIVEYEFVADSNIPATQMSFTNTYTEHSISVEIPFVKEVKQGGDVAPSEETFRLEIFDIGNSNAEEYADVTYTAEVKTKGAGKFDGKIVFTGPAGQIDSMLSEGFLVREVKGSAENWSYSDAVWAIIPEWNEQQEKVFVVYSTTKVPDADGDYYAATETSVEKMSFENTYTKNDEPQSPATGDNTMMGMLALLFVSGTGVLGTTVFSRKRKNVK